MLILRRKQGESILIGDGIEIEIIDLSAGRVKLGITAPAHVTILRKEIKLAGDQNLEAAKGINVTTIAGLLTHLRSNQSY